jgi:hypothetical protein
MMTKSRQFLHGALTCLSFDFHFVMSLFKVLDPTLGTRGHTCQSFSRAIVDFIFSMNSHIINPYSSRNDVSTK